MKRLIFATNNKHKLEEARAALSDKVEIVSLAEAGLEGEIPETADTLQGNAMQKAQWVINKLKEAGEKRKELCFDGVFADDTGLEVDALGGAPGVYSARYAGEHCSFDDNINKLLAALDGETNRRADFRTVICLIENGQSLESNGDSTDASAATDQLTTNYFEGRVDGVILTERHSNGEGFGYDPIFMPDRFALSFAEMPLDVKNRISHRGLAIKKLCEFLNA